jgi:hypothetical protein
VEHSDCEQCRWQGDRWGVDLSVVCVAQRRGEGALGMLTGGES